eukprot:TRINITY_DN27749_c0_g1_i1.p1 TRINITY_DN27749_c0_g1~~TRINITY_DN27749_c0_g1_i1.p1  ORF type:complete len:435 (+),score=96.45 TRINITY_DN27749_c0_g1_i1:96-1400(+)
MPEMMRRSLTPAVPLPACYGTGDAATGDEKMSHTPRSPWRRLNTSFVLDTNIGEGVRHPSQHLFVAERADSFSSEEEPLLALKRAETKNDLLNLTSRGVLALAVSVILFSLVPTAIQLMYAHDPDVFTPCAILCAGNMVALLAFPLAFSSDLTRDALTKLTRRELYAMLTSTVLYGAVGPALQFTALQSIPVRTMAVLQRLESVNILVLSAVFSEANVTKWTKGNSVAIVMCVVAYLYFGDPASHDATGSALLLVAGWAYSVSLYITKTELNRVAPGQIVVFRAAFGTVFYHILSAILGKETYKHLYSFALWRWMVWYGLLFVFLGQLTWTTALLNNPPALLSVGITALFPLQILWSVWVLGDWPPPADILITGALLAIVISGAVEVWFTFSALGDVRTPEDAERLDESLRCEGPFGDIAPGTPAQNDLQGHSW